mmetsp:Transcript_20025/g.42755  ORF Transcript_20025/g.42755 Transcript_20025/m.42755 type:complete len:364 (-) Transcript_20025:74-1165(-)
MCTRTQQQPLISHSSPRAFVSAHLHEGPLDLYSLPGAWIAEGKPELLHQGEAVWLSEAIGVDAQIKAVHDLPLVHKLVELLEGLLGIEAHPEVAEVGDGAWIEALKVADTRQNDHVEPLKEVHHQVSVHGHRNPGRHANTPAKGRDVFSCLYDPGVHAGDAPELLDALVHDLRVAGLGRLQSNLDADLREAMLVPRLWSVGDELPFQSAQPLPNFRHAVILHGHRLLSLFQLNRRLTVILQHRALTQVRLASWLALVPSRARDPRRQGPGRRSGTQVQSISAEGHHEGEAIGLRQWCRRTLWVHPKGREDSSGKRHDDERSSGQAKGSLGDTPTPHTAWLPKRRSSGGGRSRSRDRHGRPLPH